MHDILDQLARQRDQLATMHATVQRQGAERSRYRQRRQRGNAVRRYLPLALIGLLVALLPLSLLAANPTFSDLNDAAEVHRPNIQAIGNAGITTGFADPNDPNARLYNPKDLVTREEMASFLARTAGLGGNPPVVNAQTAVTAQTATNATNAQNAVTAQTADTATVAQNANALGGRRRAPTSRRPATPPTATPGMRRSRRSVAKRGRQSRTPAECTASGTSSCRRLMWYKSGCRCRAPRRNSGASSR